MRLRRDAGILCGVLLVSLAVHGVAARPSQDSADPFSAADAKILAEIHDHSEVMENLEYLTDHIGPRMTGTPQLKQANDWTTEMFRKYGLTNVKLEPWTIEHAWTRGSASARIVSPVTHNVTLASAAWSPGTNGVMRGPVVYFDAKTPPDFEKFRGKLKGAMVIYQEPQTLSPPAKDRPSPLLRPMQEPPPRPGQPAQPSPFAAIEEAARLRTKFFVEEGVAAVLRDSGKPHGLLNMTDISGKPFEKGVIPTAFVTGEDYRMIFRLLKQGPVQIEIELTNSFSEKPMEVFNSVAEIRGSEKPDEVVILGAHLDSWDLGTGATDNGTGSMVVLEAARALAKLNLRPKRTIRFVLFSGEEEGLVGSEKYVEAHKLELEKISAVLVHDSGTGRVMTLGLHDNYQDRELVDEVLAPLGGLQLLEPRMVRTFGTDHASFDEVGVPGFFCIQDGAEYSLTHHSQSDTFDKAWKDGLVQGAQVLAAWAYNTAELPVMLPRRPLPYRPAASSSAKAESPKPDPIAEMDEKILSQVKTDGAELHASMEYLADHIGPRLTGSPKQLEASRWAEGKFREYGLVNVHQEKWPIATGWARGSASAKIVAPTEQRLTIAAAGWSPSTNGSVRAKVIGIKSQKPEDLEQFKGKLKGAIVLVGPAFELDPPENPILTPFSETSLPLAHPRAAGEPFTLAGFIKMLLAEIKMFNEEDVAGAIMPSDKAYGLINMFAMTRGEYQPGKFPMAFTTYEGHHLLWRLLDQGPVEVELNVQNSFSGVPVEVSNTVAEIRGTEKPDEVVIVGAHIDSWDLGTGATDNGTGAIAVLEAARALVKRGAQPKRTIRFILFPGEEQGLNGSRAYVKAHKDELNKVSGVLVHDTGTGRVLTIGLMHNYAAKEAMDRVLYSIALSTGLVEPSLRTEGGSDHVPFDEAGVPAFWCVQDNVDYDRTHHSQVDTFDRVRFDDLMQGAQVLAAWAYNTAQLPDMLPRKPPPPKQEQH